MRNRDIRRATLERRLAILCERNAKLLDDAEALVADAETLPTTRMEPIGRRDARELARIVEELEQLRREEAA